MRLNLKDDPKEWRKAALMTAVGLAVLSSLLRWRRVVTNPAWLIVLALLGAAAICALLRPRWFRGYYRLSMRAGFAVSQFIGRVMLALFFFFILTPVGLILRLAGKDALQLKSPPGAASYWRRAKDCGPLDRLF
jgi:hypothetical protein